MEILFIGKRAGARARVGVNWNTTAVGLLILASITGTSSYLGYQQGLRTMTAQLLADEKFATELWQNEITENIGRIADTRQDIESTLAEVATRTGLLQAHITRLDAVAERVVAMAGLDEGEFRLKDTPSLGGTESHNTVQWRHVVGALAQLTTDLAAREDQLEGLETLLLNRELVEATFPTGNPVEKGWVSSGYGYRTDPLSGAREFHRGVDLAGKLESNVHAVADGVVTRSGKRKDFGNLIEVSHGGGYVTRYAHNERNLVKVGDRVSKDQVIAVLGTTGHSTGPHVHFEVLQNGNNVNPSTYLQARR